MSRLVWKFPLRSGGWNEVTVGGEDSRVVLVGVDPAEGVPAVWIEHRPGLVWVNRLFAIYGTGHPVPKEATHVGSVIVGVFVWHVYERNL